VNLAPRPIPSLAASIVPPCCSTRFFTIARPSPGPVAGEISPCRNGSNTCGRKSGWMPDSRVLDQLAERLRVPVDRRPRLRDTGGAHDLRTSEHAQPTTRQWRSAACAIRATRWRGTAGRDDDAVFGMNADRRDEERHGPRRKIGSPRGDAGSWSHGATSARMRSPRGSSPARLAQTLSHAAPVLKRSRATAVTSHVTPSAKRNLLHHVWRWNGRAFAANCQSFRAPCG
jgi:hypothetical protein